MLKEFKYVYLFRRCAHEEATLILKKRMWNAAKIEKQLHRYFDTSRFRLTKKIWRFKWMQMHIKIGISKNPQKRLQSVNNDFFKSGNTEWFAMNIIELIFVYLWIVWYAYRWWIFLTIIAIAWYFSQGNIPIEPTNIENSNGIPF